MPLELEGPLSRFRNQSLLAVGYGETYQSGVHVPGTCPVHTLRLGGRAMPAAPGAVLEDFTPLYRETDVWPSDVGHGPDFAQEPVSGGSPTSPMSADVLWPRKPANLQLEGIDLRLEITPAFQYGKSVSIPIRFKRELLQHDRVLIGQDASHSIFITLSGDIGVGALASLTWQIPGDVAAKDLSNVISVIRHLQSPNDMRLKGPDGSTIAILHSADGNNLDKITEIYLSLVEALGRVQEKTNTSFPAPKKFTQDEANVLAWADRLLQGETVMGTWQQASMILHTTDSGRSAIDDRATNSSAAYLFAQPQGIEITGHIVPLGTIGTHFLAGDISELNDVDQSNDAVRLTLIPGETNEYETWVITPEAPIKDVIPGVSRRFRKQAREFMKQNDELLRRLAR